MTTKTSLAIEDINVEPDPSSAINERPKHPVEDGSSSSLSEPGDQSDNQDFDDQEDAEDLDNYDTEAETERLEETPRKPRNVVVGSTNGVYRNSHDPLESQPENIGQAAENDAPTNEISAQLSGSSPNESLGEDHTPSRLSSRKRKRAQPGASDELKGHSDGAGRSRSSQDLSLEHSAASSTTPHESEKVQISSGTSQVLKRSSRKEKSKGNKRDRLAASRSRDLTPAGSGLEQNADVEDAASSNGEEGEMEDACDMEGLDTESAVKTEEGPNDSLVLRKRTAMDSLSAIENCFATLRDKIFDERLTLCNEELAQLEKPELIHPELLLMKSVLDKRRDQKIHYEQTRLKLKLQSLQRESIANKAAAHSQYMQTVAEIREKSLSSINKDIHQTQRERRSCEAEVPDYMYKFSTKRSQQIIEQIAYNEEISLLSGVAKYVGFPAAPQVLTARPKEFDIDRRNIDQGIAAIDDFEKRHHMPSLRASLSVASTFPRTQSGAEDQFLQQNAWANPHHPAHQMHRQISAVSRVPTPSSTPLNQKRAIDSSLYGSASTIPEPPSGPSSLVVPTPVTSGIIPESRSTVVFPTQATDATPSRIPVGGDVSQMTISANGSSYQNPHISNGLGRISNSASTPSKSASLPQVQAPMMSSPAAQFSVIKTEDATRHIPLPENLQGKALNTGGDTQTAYYSR